MATRKTNAPADKPKPNKPAAKTHATKAKPAPTRATRAKSSAAKDKPASATSLAKSTPRAPQRSAKILITGGTGFLGAQVVKALLAAGEKNLRVLTTSPPAWLRDAGVEIIEGSITDAATVAQGVKNVSLIYHLAGKVSREQSDAHEMYAVHVAGTRLLCEAATAGKVKTIVMASTSGTIAVAKDEIVSNERRPAPLPIISRWAYYASKYYQERAALENFDGDGRKLVLLNPSLLLGAGDERLSSTQVILDFLARKIALTPRGGLSFVDVADVVPVFLNAAERGKHGERYLLGAANWTFDKFFARLERISGVAAPRLALPSRVAVVGSRWLSDIFKNRNATPPVEAEAVEMAEHFWYLDASKAQRELGFTPRDPGETLMETVRYVRNKFLGIGALT